MEEIDNQIYDEISDTWWEEDGFMAVLRTSINPPRFKYFQDILINRFKLQPKELKVLDVGCGGGLLSEQFASIGCQVTGVDQSLPSLNAARSHASKSSLDIQYIESTGEDLPFDEAQFDIVCCCDVLEHVDNLDTVIEQISRVLKPGGIFFFDTINRTQKSKLFAIKAAQDWKLTRFLPKNVHVWEKFIKPVELNTSLRKYGLPQAEFIGLSSAINPIKALFSIAQQKLGYINFAELGGKLKLKQSRDTSVAYMGFSIRSLRP